MTFYTAAEIKMGSLAAGIVDFDHRTAWQFPLHRKIPGLILRVAVGPGIGTDTETKKRQGTLGVAGRNVQAIGVGILKRCVLRESTVAAEFRTGIGGKASPCVALDCGP